MPTAERVRDLTLDTIDVARDRAEDLVSTSARGLSVAVSRAVDEVRELRPDLDLSSVEVPSVDQIVHGASSHKLRTTLIVSLVLLLIVVIARKATGHDDEPAAPAAG
jgi:hypothetical protein